MGTRWKKFRIIVSFTAFFLGITLLLMNVIPILCLTAEMDFQAGDYQKTEVFADYMSERLGTLIGAAVGGENWDGSSYGFSDTDTYSYEGDVSSEAGSFDFSDGIRSSFGGAEENTVDLSEVTSSEEEASDSSNGTESYRDSYLKDLEGDSNVLFAVMYQGKLLSTNLEGLTAQKAEKGNMPDFDSYLPEEVSYNFTLCYNAKGDGKVEIIKDGTYLDVYGNGIYGRDSRWQIPRYENGIYGQDSRWKVPGYENFEAEGDAREVVVFLAAAEEPKLYVESYGQGTIQRGGILYNMYKNQVEQSRMFLLRIYAICVGVIFLLLFPIFHLRASFEEAKKWIGCQLGSLWIEVKIVIFWGLPFLLLLVSFLGGIFLSLFSQGTGLTLCFWPIYFGFLDRTFNKGRQRSFLRPFRESLRIRDLGRPLQKRLVRRQWLSFALCLLLLIVLAWFFLLLWDALYWEAVIPLFVLFMLCAVLVVGFSLSYLKRNRRLAEDIGLLTDRIAEVRAGELSDYLELPEDTDLREAAENLNEISQGMEKALEERTKSERMKVELVANVSHDLKTPLTSIVSYIDLLEQEKNLPEHVKDYIRILSEKSERLKNIVQDVFEVSKAASGQLPVHLEELDFGKLLRQTLADMNIQIEKSELTLRTTIPEEPVLIQADGQRLYRVFQNLIQNALQYSLKGSRVYLTLTTQDGKACASVKNISAAELDTNTDFTERFVRGDTSRSDGGNGLGLSIAKSFTEACGGELQVKAEADLFVASVTFPVKN